jgi:hypothetical protein
MSVVPLKAKSKLRAVEPKKAKPSKPKIVIYGKPGVGKTWASLDFPSVYYIDSEGGADLAHYTDKLKKSGGVYLGVEQGGADMETILEQVQALATEKHEYKTLVIDSISKVFNNEIAKEAERLGDKNAFGADKKPAVGMMRRLVRWLQRIDMNVVLICHEKAEWGMNAKGERVEIGATFDCWDKLEYELHLCLNIQKNGGSRTARVRKTRLEEFKDGDLFAWSFDSFAEKYGADVIKADVKPVELASTEQLSELKKYLEIVKMPDDWQEKCLKKADIDSFEEMDADKIQALIDFLKTKTNPNL